MLNLKQQHALRQMKKGENLFITGSAGTGKSFLIEAIKNWSNSKGKQILICAPTGKAAEPIGGVTIHRAFRAPEGLILADPTYAPTAVTGADIVLIDEISMVRWDLFEYVIKTIDIANDIRGQNGLSDIQLIVFGDFYQLPPFYSKAESYALCEYMDCDAPSILYAFESQLWVKCNFKNIELTEIIRQTDDEFLNALAKARVGDSDCIEYFNSMTSQSPADDSMWLMGRRVDVLKRNNEMLEAFDATKTFKSKSEGAVSETDKRCPDELTLAVGCRVIALANAEKYSNGSMGTVTKLNDQSIRVRFDNGATETIGYCDWPVYDYTTDYDTNGNPVLQQTQVGTYSQIPVTLGYAMTIHKAQGMTLDSAVISPATWDPGQLYVALSRVRTIEGIYLTSPISRSALIVSPKVIEFMEQLSIDVVSHGGKRPGAGRKASRIGKSTPIRIPDIYLDDVKAYVERLKIRDGFTALNDV